MLILGGDFKASAQWVGPTIVAKAASMQPSATREDA
jgi:hypothetical protein